jgi:hypothetical protein
LLAACGDASRPFMGAPGVMASRLARPPPMRVAVVPPSNLQLPAVASNLYAEAVANALQSQEVPAVVAIPRPGDWRLDLGAVRSGTNITPAFSLASPSGPAQGAERMRPIPWDTWRLGRPQMLRDVAAEAAPRIVRLLAGVDAARRHTAPANLNNRPRRVAVTEVTGAPGDGDQALLRLMRTKLAQLGPVVQESPVDADFIVKARVQDRPVNASTRKVKISWQVLNGRGEEIGRLEQQNDVPKGMLDRYWGDVAVVVTDEAAVAVRDVILNETGQR